MGNTITPSFYTRSIAWLTEQTSLTKANDKNANSAIRWVAKQPRANNIAIGSGILFVASWILGHFTRDSDNKFLNYVIKGIKWLSGIATISFPLANFGSKKETEFTSKPLFSTDDPELKDKFLKSFVEDLNLSIFDYINASLLPRPSLSKDYREKIYTVVLELVKDKQDPLFLSTPLESVPEKIRTRASELRRELLRAYEHELGSAIENPQLQSDIVIKTIEAILDESKEIPRYQWNEDAKKQKELDEQNSARYAEFKKWGINVIHPPIAETELKTIFDQLSQSQKENIHLLNDFYVIDNFSLESDLNIRFKKILEIMTLDLQTQGEKLTQENSEKGLFLFKYLNALIEKKVSVGREEDCVFGNRLDEERRNNLLLACRYIVHDKESFPLTERGLDFFTNPPLTCVPGQALSLHHKLTPCFSNGHYVDLYGLKDFVLDRVVDNISPPPGAHSINGGFLLSGSRGTGKAYFARVLANQLAVPLVILNKNIITMKGGSPLVKMPDGREITVGAFFDELKSSGSCVLLMDKVEQFLPPRECDDGYVAGLKLPEGKDELTDFFLSSLQNIRDEKGASKIIIIMTTDYPPTQDIEVDSIDEHGESTKAENELHKYVSSTAIRPRRIDYKIFSFHKRTKI